MLIVAVYNSY